MTSSRESSFKTVITADRHSVLYHLREALSYRDLILLFVRRNFTARYKQTLLGPLWALLQPLLTTFVFSLVFGRLGGLTTADVPGGAGIPRVLFYLCGSICWSLFAGTLQEVSDTFRSNRGTMGKVYYPRLTAPIATALSRCITFGLQLAMLAVLILFFAFSGGNGLRLSPMLAMLPVLLLQLLLLALGVGLLISSVTTKYRDLAMLVGFGLQLWHYATPVVYGLSLVTDKAAEQPLPVKLYLLNPMTQIITGCRYALLGSGYFDPVLWLISLGLTLLLLLLGLMAFGRVERNFMDTI